MVSMRRPSELRDGDVVLLPRDVGAACVDDPVAFTVQSYPDYVDFGYDGHGWGGFGWRIRVRYADGSVGFREWDKDDPTVPIRAII